MRIDREVFLNVLKTSIGAISKKGTLSYGCLDCFYFDGEFIHAYNNYMGISVKIETDFNDVVIEAALLLKFISKITNDVLSITFSKGSLIVASGRMKTKIQPKILEEDSSYDIKYMVNILKEDRKGEWKNLPGDFFDCLSFCEITGNDVNGAGVYVFGDEIYDKSNIELTYGKMQEKIENFAIDETIIKELYKINGLKKYLVSKDFVHFCDENEDKIISIRLLNYNFDKNKTDEKFVIPYLKKGIFSCIFPEKFAEILDKASLFAKNDVVHLIFNNSGFTIKSKNEYGEFSEYLQWEKENVPEMIGESEFSIYVRIYGLKHCLSKGTFFFNAHKREEDYILSFSNYSNRLCLFTCCLADGKDF